MNPQQALIVAMEMLRVAVQNSTTALLGNAANLQRVLSAPANSPTQSGEGSGNRGSASSPTALTTDQSLHLVAYRLQANSQALIENTAAIRALQSWLDHLASEMGGGRALPTATPVALPPRPVATPIKPKPKPAAEVPNPFKNSLKDIGKNFAGKIAGTGAISGVVGKMGPIGLAASPILGVLEKVVGKFADLLSPMAILSQAMESPIAGFQLIGKATKLLANVLAPVFLPVTVLVAAGLTTVAGILFTELEPAMNEWFDLILNDGIPVIQELIDEFKDAIAAVKQFYNALPDRHSADRGERRMAYAGQYGAALSLGPLAPAALSGLLYRDVFGGGDIVEEAKRRQAERKRNGKDDTRKEFAKSLRDVMGSLRTSIGPQAQIGSLGDVGRQVQLAALNQDPLEAQLQKMQLKVFANLEKAIARYLDSSSDDGKRVYDPGIPGIAKALFNQAASLQAAMAFFGG